MRRAWRSRQISSGQEQAYPAPLRVTMVRRPRAQRTCPQPPRPWRHPACGRRSARSWGLHVPRRLALRSASCRPRAKSQVDTSGMIVVAHGRASIRRRQREIEIAVGLAGMQVRNANAQQRGAALDCGSGGARRTSSDQRTRTNYHRGRHAHKFAHRSSSRFQSSFSSPFHEMEAVHAGNDP